MQYVNFVAEADDQQSLYTGPVPESDAAYLRKAIIHLKPLSDEEYITGPGYLLNTLARFSYVLDDNDLFWCIEWQPGLLVVRMGPDKEIQWAAIRSPVPNFGGREPLPEDGDPDAYDEDENPQYNLVFTPWDAQFDKQNREWGSFTPADKDVQSRFENASAHANRLGTVMNSRSADDDRWFERCLQNIEKWSGKGVRLESAEK